MSAAVAARRLPRWAGLVALGALLLFALAVLELRGLDALHAAGLTGIAPAHGAGAFRQLISTLQQNAEWLIATGLGLGITLVAGMFLLGSMRAPDYVLRIGMGIAILLVVGPGLLA